MALTAGRASPDRQIRQVGWKSTYCMYELTNGKWGTQEKNVWIKSGVKENEKKGEDVKKKKKSWLSILVFRPLRVCQVALWFIFLFYSRICDVNLTLPMVGGAPLPLLFPSFLHTFLVPLFPFTSVLGRAYSSKNKWTVFSFPFFGMNNNILSARKVYIARTCTQK